MAKFTTTVNLTLTLEIEAPSIEDAKDEAEYSVVQFKDALAEVETYDLTINHTHARVGEVHEAD